MATAPIQISFVTVTLNTVTVAITPPTDPLYDHALIFVYDVLTGALIHTSAPIAGPTYTTPVLSPNRAYSVVGIAVDTGGENSEPSNELVTAETNAHNNVVGDPRVVITDVVQESNTKVRIEYRLEDVKELLGELVNAEYSFNGLFTDALQMQEAMTDPRHDGRFFLQFQDPPMIVDPHHYFIWDISELPKNTVHEFQFRFRGKSGALYTGMVVTPVDIDTTEPVGDHPVPVVVADTGLLFRLPLLNGQTPLTGATVTVTEIRDDTDTNLLGAPVVIPALAAPNDYIHQDTIALAVGTYPPGRYRVFYTVAGAGYASSGSNMFVVVANNYDINFALGAVDLCLVYGKLVDNLNRPLVGAQVQATYIREPSRYDRVAVAPLQVLTNEFGFFAMHLLQNTEVVLEIPKLSYGEKLKVPEQSAALFSSIQFNQPSTLVRGPFGHVRPPEFQ